MVSSARLDWLLQQVHGGRSCSVRFSFNPVTMTEKVQFTLETWDGIHRSIFRPGTMGALLSLQAAMDYSVVTDKGHTSSKGKSVVEFWVSAPCPSGFGSGVQVAPGSLGAPAVTSWQTESTTTLVEHEVEKLRAIAASQIRALEEERRDAQRQLIHDCVLAGLEDKLEGLRGIVPSWPPMTDMDEATGCEKIREMILQSCLKAEYVESQEPQFRNELREILNSRVGEFLQKLKEDLQTEAVSAAAAGPCEGTQ